jgi:hypothetical protein
MFLPILIKLQQKHIERRIEKLVAKRKKVEYQNSVQSAIAIKKASNACLLYELSAKSGWSFVKSYFLPSTPEFKLRLKAAAALSGARAELNRIEKGIKQSPLRRGFKATCPTGVVRVCESQGDSLQLGKSKSDTEVYLQRKQHNKVFQKPTVKEAEDVIGSLNNYYYPTVALRQYIRL